MAPLREEGAKSYNRRARAVCVGECLAVDAWNYIVSPKPLTGMICETEGVEAETPRNHPGSRGRGPEGPAACTERCRQRRGPPRHLGTGNPPSPGVAAARRREASDARSSENLISNFQFLKLLSSSLTVRG